MNTQVSSLPSKRLGRALGIGWLLAGAFFLFDPYFSALDLLPDFLGYLFFALGLCRLSDLDARLAESARGARRLALVSAVRFAAIIIAFGFVSDTEQPMFILLIAFSLAIADCILFIPMWKNFGAGMIYLGSRNEGTAVFAHKTGKRYSATEKYAAFSGVYFVLREALAVLPELTVLTDERGGADSVGGESLYRIVGALRGFCVLASLTLGIVWLVCTVVYVCRLCSDKPFFAKLKERYAADVLSRPDLFAMRAVKCSLGFLIAAALLAMDLYLEGYNLLPDLLPALLVILSLFFLRRYAKKQAWAYLTSIAYAVMAVVTWVMQFFTININQLGEVSEDDLLFAGYERMAVMQTLCAVLFCVAFFLTLRTLYTLVKKYTGIRAFHANSNYAAERTDAIHGIIRKKLLIVGAFVVLTAVSTLVQWIVVPLIPPIKYLIGADLELMNATSRTLIITAYQLLTEGYWFVDLALGAGLVAALISATSEITEQMEYSYMMNE